MNNKDQMYDEICRVLTEYDWKDDPEYKDIDIEDHAEQMFRILHEVARAIENCELVFREDNEW